MKAERATNERDFYFEKIGENFDKWISDYDTYRRGLLIQKHLGTQGVGKSCLEIGCGTGKISEMMVGRVGALTVSDISEKLAKQVGERLNVSAMQQDACALNIPDNSYDVVISSECIEHSPNPKKALQEMARVLKPCGLLVVTTPNKLWYPLIWLTTITAVRNFAGREVWLFPQQARSILNEAGLNDVTLDGCHLFPWQIPLAKKLLPLFDKAGRWLYPLMINFCVTGTKPVV